MLIAVPDLQTAEEPEANLTSFMSKELSSFSIWVSWNNGSHCSRQDCQGLPKTKATLQEGARIWTQTWAQTWNQIIVLEPGDYFLAKWLFKRGKKAFVTVESSGTIERQSYKPFARKQTVAIYFPYTPQNRVCMHSLLICWIATWISSPNGNSLTSPWVLDVLANISMATAQVTNTESVSDFREKLLLQPKIKIAKHQCLILSRNKCGKSESQCDKFILRVFSIHF